MFTVPIEEPKKSEQKDIIKVTTDRWVNHRNELVIKKTIRQMRRMTVTENGYYALEEELNNVGTDAISSCPGIEQLEDGLYEMYVVYYGHDIETGYIDEVEFGFRPIEEEDV